MKSPILIELLYWALNIRWKKKYIELKISSVLKVIFKQLFSFLLLALRKKLLSGLLFLSYLGGPPLKFNAKLILNSDFLLVFLIYVYFLWASTSKFQPKTSAKSSAVLKEEENKIWFQALIYLSVALGFKSTPGCYFLESSNWDTKFFLLKS